MTNDERSSNVKMTEEHANIGAANRVASSSQADGRGEGDQWPSGRVVDSGKDLPLLDSKKVTAKKQR